jgi:hypothetical protein
MTQPDLEALVGQLEQATGPDRELDLAIALAVGAVDRRTVSTKHGFGYSDGQWACSHVEQYTALLDAAMMLVPEGWHDAVYGPGVGASDNLCTASLDPPEYDGPPETAEAATRALALVAAALRARLRTDPAS